MKKFLIFIGVIMLLIISVIVVIPMMFQSELQELAMEEANKNVKAEVELGDFNLSLIPNFPRLTVEISGLKVSGINEFAGTTLFEAELITTTLDVMKLYNGEIEIGEVGVDGMNVHVLVLKNGLANYDIAIETESTDEEEEIVVDDEETESSDFNMKLTRYFIHNFNLIYDDQDGDMYFEMNNMNHEGKGDFSLSEFILETKTSIESMSFNMEGEELLKKASLNSNINMAMNMDQMKFQFDTTFIQLNALILNINGWLAMPNDSIDMDLKMSSKNNSFKELFSLIPNAYIEDYEDVKVTGRMSFGAAFKGVYYEDLMPAFSVNLGVHNGNVQYPDLPAAAEKIEIDLDINSPSSNLNHMVIDLKKAHLELAQNYFDMSLKVANSITNPTMGGNLKMDFDLSTIPQMMPVEEGEEYQGKMKTDIHFRADMNSLDHEKYDQVEANGLFEAWDIAYDDGTDGVPMMINHVAMKFDMNKVDLTAFDANIGNSDVHAKGGLENFIPWYMSEATLKGNLDFNSNYFDVDEWMTEDEVAEDVAPEVETESVANDSIPVETNEIPTNIDFTLNASMKKIAYDSMNIEDLVGTILIKEGKVFFDNTQISMFEGNATMSGVFDPTTSPKSPTFNFDMGIHDWAIKPMANTFNTIDKLAPVLKTADGTFSTDIHTEGILDANLEPVLDKLSFNGISKFKNLQVGSENLEKLNDITKTKDYNPLKAEDILLEYRCSNGVLEVEPFEVKVGTQKAKISGYTTLNEEINYLIDTKIKTSEMGAGADAVISQVNGLLASNGVKSEVPDVIPVTISVTGKVDDPIFKPVFGKGEASKEAKEQVKELVKEKIEEVKEDLKKDAQAEADKIMEDARKQQQELMAEARKQAEQLNKEADKLSKQLIAEADKQGKDLIKQATNPLTKIAAEKGAKEINKKAAEQAKKLKQEAKTQGDNLVKKTQVETDKILADAKKKADAKIQGL